MIDAAALMAMGVVLLGLPAATASGAWDAIRGVRLPLGLLLLACGTARMLLGRRHLAQLPQVVSVFIICWIGGALAVYVAMNAGRGALVLVPVVDLTAHLWWGLASDRRK
jgi:hypothetical protein